MGTCGLVLLVQSLCRRAIARWLGRQASEHTRFVNCATYVIVLSGLSILFWSLLLTETRSAALFAAHSNPRGRLLITDIFHAAPLYDVVAMVRKHGHSLLLLLLCIAVLVHACSGPCSFCHTRHWSGYT